jgi:hypothetical protein
LLPPALIYQAVSGTIQDTWLQDFDPSIHQTFFTSSPSGWTNDEIGLEWIKTFNKLTEAKARTAYRLILLDGHGSHLTKRFIDYCDENRILLCLYPPHSTHTLQPLDVCCFRPLSVAYSQELSEFLFTSQGLTAITKRDFFRLFNKAWQTTFTPKLIASAFKSTGIEPLDPSVILNKFNQKQVDRPSSAESTQLVLSITDWRAIRALLAEVVDSMDDRRTRTLGNSIQKLIVQTQLLSAEVDGLRGALANEKKRRQRGKPLQLAAPTENQGGAIFWSPNKVLQYRDRQVQKEAAAEAQRLQKEEDKILREEKKAEKQRQLEERRRIRATAKEVRLQQAAEKRQQNQEALIARKANQQLQNELKSTRKPRKKTTTAAVQIEEDPINSSTAPEVVVAPVQFSRRGRQIKVPERFGD